MLVSLADWWFTQGWRELLITDYALAHSLAAVWWIAACVRRLSRPAALGSTISTILVCSRLCLGSSGPLRRREHDSTGLGGRCESGPIHVDVRCEQRLGGCLGLDGLFRCTSGGFAPTPTLGAKQGGHLFGGSLGSCCRNVGRGARARSSLR